MDYLVKLTDKKAREVLHYFTEDMFLTVFSKIFKDGDFSFSRYRLFSTVGIASELVSDSDLMYEPIYETNERYNPENRDFLERLSAAIKACNFLKDHFSKNYVNEFIHKDIKSIINDYFDDINDEDRANFSNDKTVRRLVYSFGTQI